jgi:hypothetical protein
MRGAAVVGPVVLAGAILPSALAAGTFLHVSPASAGTRTTIVFTGGRCVARDQVTLISRLFPGHAFGGEGAVYVRAGRNGDFTRRFRIPAGTAHRTYVVSGRCGGGNLGVTVRVRVR